MGKKKYLFLIIFLFLFNIHNIKAETCDKQDIERLKQIANNITYTYEYIGDKYNYQLYNVTFYNLTDEIYIRQGNFNYFENDLTIDTESGNNKFEVYAYNCFEKRVSTININLPKFNEYSQSSECEEIGKDNLDICYEWYQGNLTYDQFINEIDNYNQKHNNDKDIIKILKDNYLYVIAGGVILLIIIILLIIHRKKKNRLD